jgi:hypothetical protein
MWSFEEAYDEETSANSGIICQETAIYDHRCRPESEGDYFLFRNSETSITKWNYFTCVEILLLFFLERGKWQRNILRQKGILHYTRTVFCPACVSSSFVPSLHGELIYMMLV